MPVDRDRLIMLVMVGKSVDLICFNRVVIGSRSQYEPGEFDMSVETSSIVAG